MGFEPPFSTTRSDLEVKYFHEKVSSLLSSNHSERYNRKSISYMAMKEHFRQKIPVLFEVTEAVIIPLTSCFIY